MIGVALLLIAVGAILRFAITAHLAGVSIHTVGVILIIVGVVALGIGRAYSALSAAPAATGRGERP
jgi:hypothetical protein